MTDDLDTAELRKLGVTGLHLFCAEYGLEGLLNSSERDGFKTGYAYAKESQSDELSTLRVENEKNLAALRAIRDKFDDLQDDYADIAMDMTADEKQVTNSKSRNVQIKFGLSVADIISGIYKDIPRAALSPKES